MPSKWIIEAWGITIYCHPIEPYQFPPDRALTQHQGTPDEWLAPFKFSFECYMDMGHLRVSMTLKWNFSKFHQWARYFWNRFHNMEMNMVTTIYFTAFDWSLGTCPMKWLDCMYLQGIIPIITTVSNPRFPFIFL